MTAPDTLPAWLTSWTDSAPMWVWGLLLFAVVFGSFLLAVRGWKALTPALPTGWVVWRENREAAYLLWHQDGELWQDEAMTLYEGKVSPRDDLTPLADPNVFVEVLEEDFQA